MPKQTLTFTPDEIADHLRATILPDADKEARSKAKVTFNVRAGLSGNDPRERHEPHLESISIEIP